jgi:hypothetical protein
MYDLKNYLLSMRSHWMVHQPTYQAVQETLPLITKYQANKGIEKLGNTPAKKVCRQVFPDVYTFPLFRRQWCKLMVEEIELMRKELTFEANEDEDVLRQIPEIVLKTQCPALYRNMWFVVQTVINPIIVSLWQRPCKDAATIQIANYNIVDKKQGAWHHDESADISVVVPLNTGSLQRWRYGVPQPWPAQAAAQRARADVPVSFTNLHRGLPVDGGDRYLLVFWLYDKSRVVKQCEDID